MAPETVDRIALAYDQDGLAYAIKLGALQAYKAALAVIEGAVALKPDEITYTASKEHALARIEDVRNQARGCGS